MRYKIANALSYIDDQYIAQAARKRKRRYAKWIVPVAAILAFVLLWETPNIPLIISAKAVSIASESRKTDLDNKNKDWAAYRIELETRSDNLEKIIYSLGQFTDTSSRNILLHSNDENVIWSPVNAYIGLAMTAELAGTDAKQNLFHVLGVDKAEDLRNGIAAAWETLYTDNGKEICKLANSLWIDDSLIYDQEKMDLLSFNYYGSVYQGALASEKVGKDIQKWLTNQTGGILKDHINARKQNPDTVLSLISTIYFQSQWTNQFDPLKNTTDIFHSVQGDIETEYMNMDSLQTHYYWGESYGAIALPLNNDTRMWLILPDADKTVSDVIIGGSFRDCWLIPELPENSKYTKVNLSLPKFEFAIEVDLKPVLQSMGLSSLLDPSIDSFSPALMSKSKLPLFISSINQTSKIGIDEEGVTAASYVIIDLAAGAAMPPDEIIDFQLNRPFIFAIEKSGIPIYEGIVYTP